MREDIKVIPKGMSYYAGNDKFSSDGLFVLGYGDGFKETIKKNEVKYIGGFSLDYLKKMIQFAEEMGEEDSEILKVYLTNKNELGLCFLGNYCLAPIMPDENKLEDNGKQQEVGE